MYNASPSPPPPPFVRLIRREELPLDNGISEILACAHRLRSRDVENFNVSQSENLSWLRNGYDESPKN